MLSRPHLWNEAIDISHRFIVASKDRVAENESRRKKRREEDYQKLIQELKKKERHSRRVSCLLKINLTSINNLDNSIIKFRIEFLKIKVFF